MGRYITEVKQLGFVTDRIEKSTEAFTRIGLADWSPATTVSADKGFERMVSKGKPCDFAFRCAVNNELDIEFELIEPLDDKSDYADFLKKNGGPGLHHISVDCDDIEEVQRSGHELLVQGKTAGIPFGFQYFDFRKDLGTVLEYFPAPIDE